jgi:hypothetical protein
MTLVHTTVILQTRQEPLNSRAPDLPASSVAEGLLCFPGCDKGSYRCAGSLPVPWEPRIGRDVTPGYPCA